MIDRGELMGLHKPERERTAAERTLAGIILCQPPERVFDDEHPRRRELLEQQEEFFALRLEFFRPRSRWLPYAKRRQTAEERLREIAARLLELDEHLSRHAAGWDLNHAPPAPGAELEQ